MKHNAVQALYTTANASTAIVASLVAARLGASEFQLGLLGAAYGFAALASHWLFGRAADRYDRRRFVLVGTLVSAASVALGAWAFDVPSFLAIRFVQGFAAGVFPAALAVFVYEERRPLGKFTSFGSLGWVLGSLLVMATPWLAAAAGHGDVFDVVFLAASVPLLAAFAVAWRFSSKRAGLAVPLLPRAVLRGSASVYVPMLMRHSGATAVWVIFPLFIVDTLGGSLRDVGLVHLVNVATQFLILQNVERLPLLRDHRVLVPIGLATSAATFLGFLFVRDVAQLLPWQAVLGVSWGTLWLGSLKQCLETNIERATATGLLNSSVSLSNIVGPLAGGLLAQRFGYESTMVFAAALSLAAMPVHRLLAARAPRPSAAAVPEESP